MKKPISLLAASLSAFVLGTAALAATPPPERSGEGEPAFRSLYKELVETNTTLSAGDCTLAAERMAAHLKAAGYAGDDLRVWQAPDHPKEGGLVARLAGSDAKSKGILLLAHIDVVEANRADWTRDPFTLVEEGGYFYARGASDDKAMAAIFTDLMVRLKQEGYKPKKRVTLALTCGEETPSAFNGAAWLAKEHKDWIDAEFALNEGGGGRLDEKGHRDALSFEGAEKFPQDFLVETTNPGGHSSQPVPDNALYEMGAALVKLSQYEFPVQFNDTTRAYFSRMAGIVGGETGAAMKKLLVDSQDAAANAIVSKDKAWHSMLRTTCVATMINGGHAVNALPQRVSLNVNCRIFPGSNIEGIRRQLADVIGNPKATVTRKPARSGMVPVPTLDPKVLGLIEQVSARVYPGVPVVPMMATGATDGVFLAEAGIPFYGLTAMFADPDGGGVHGLNERIRVQSVIDGRRFHYQFVKAWTGS
jgi:acetylornithine deacetylase/succinyl-diaminopimelate desuccinylase-like protein